MPYDLEFIVTQNIYSQIKQYCEGTFSKTKAG